MMKYSMFSCSVPGRKYSGKGLSCQDYSGSRDFGGGVKAIAAADGHGGPDYFRSEKGARFAVETFFDLVEYTKTHTKDDFKDYLQTHCIKAASPDKIAENQESAAAGPDFDEDFIEFAKDFTVTEWRRKVLEDWRKQLYDETGQPKELGAGEVRFADITEKYRLRYNEEAERCRREREQARAGSEAAQKTPAPDGTEKAADRAAGQAASETEKNSASLFVTKKDPAEDSQTDDSLAEPAKSELDNSEASAADSDGAARQPAVSADSDGHVLQPGTVSEADASAVQPEAAAEVGAVKLRPDLQECAEAAKDDYQYLYVAYGTTFLGACLFGSKMLILQIGDGSCSVLIEEGKFIRPIEEDSENFGNVTVSLCDRRARKKLRHAVLECGGENRPLAVCLCSDGLWNCYYDDDDLCHLYGYFFRSLEKYSLEEIESELRGPEAGSGEAEEKGILQDLTDQYSKDDLSLAYFLADVKEENNQSAIIGAANKFEEYYQDKVKTEEANDKLETVKKKVEGFIIKRDEDVKYNTDEAEKYIVQAKEAVKKGRTEEADELSAKIETHIKYAEKCAGQAQEEFAKAEAVLRELSEFKEAEGKFAEIFREADELVKKAEDSVKRSDGRIERVRKLKGESSSVQEPRGRLKGKYCGLIDTILKLREEKKLLLLFEGGFGIYSFTDEGESGEKYTINYVKRWAHKVVKKLTNNKN